MAFGDMHIGKIFTVDNGDYGIRHQAGTLPEFLDSIFDLNEMTCTLKKSTKA